MGAGVIGSRSSFTVDDERVVGRLAYLAQRRFGLPPAVGCRLAEEARAAFTPSARELVQRFEAACLAHVRAVAIAAAGRGETPPAPGGETLAGIARAEAGRAILAGLAAAPAATREVHRRIVELGAKRADLRDGRAPALRTLRLVDPGPAPDAGASDSPPRRNRSA